MLLIDKSILFKRWIDIVKKITSKHINDDWEIFLDHSDEEGSHEETHKEFILVGDVNVLLSTNHEIQTNLA